jgi:hypothetical protein
VLFINKRIYIKNELQRGKAVRKKEQRGTKKLKNYLYRSKRLEKASLAAVILRAWMDASYRKPDFQRWKAGLPLLKIVISLLPNEPSSNHKYFHEEVGVKLVSCFSHHGVEIWVEIPVDTEVPPTLLTEGAGEK